MKKNSRGTCGPTARCAPQHGGRIPGRSDVHGGALGSSLRRSGLLPARCHDAKAERRLALAVLTEAVRCFQTHAVARDRRGRRLFREAEQWLMDRDQGPEFSFENICEALKLDPNYLRHGLQRWREHQQQAN